VDPYRVGAVVQGEPAARARGDGMRCMGAALMPVAAMIAAWCSQWQLESRVYWVALGSAAGAAVTALGAVATCALAWVLMTSTRS
jgi:hypothetical protein